MCARNSNRHPRRRENSGRDIVVHMRSFTILVAAIVLIAAVQRHGLKAVPYSSLVGFALKTVPRSTAVDQAVPTSDQGTWSEKARLGEQRTEAAVVFAN